MIKLNKEKNDIILSIISSGKYINDNNINTAFTV